MSSIPFAPVRARATGATVLRWSSRLLATVAWTSTALFGLYILAFYGGAVVTGAMARWNSVLPGLYGERTPLANAGMSLHFVAGGLILVLGCVQLLPAVRTRWPAVHRWAGRIYASAALCAGVGGLTYIFVAGTIGGTVMDLGFGLYGALTVLAAVQAWRHGRARRLEQHRAWALRLLALAIGSWLYRMDYGIWLMLAGGAGHAKDFSGPFDHVMAFFFYLPNLLVVEAWLRARRTGVGAPLRWSVSALMLAAAGLLAVGTYYFTLYYWWPGILGRVPG
jgi:hypothetical protein